MSASSSIGLKRPGTNKKLWTYDEESKLIEALIELYHTGRFKADRGFRAGHFKAVEEILEAKLPGSGIEAKPHIKSKMRTLKTNFSIVYNMLTGNNCSGFGWDPN